MAQHDTHQVLSSTLASRPQKRYSTARYQMNRSEETIINSLTEIIGDAQAILAALADRQRAFDAISVIARSAGITNIGSQWETVVREATIVQTIAMYASVSDLID
jgi:tRNA U55 pseudouridine synthase TruB